MHVGSRSCAVGCARRSCCAAELRQPGRWALDRLAPVPPGRPPAPAGLLRLGMEGMEAAGESPLDVLSRAASMVQGQEIVPTALWGVRSPDRVPPSLAPHRTDQRTSTQGARPSDLNGAGTARRDSGNLSGI
ncbi:hypothetical protein FJT64_020009 [Amphibalanus amphitrite]|uniref:Uncharacterized protein n=1 Tax=Amphibalanus amphitrite TaxID=1232801 RepID=A0A6A4WRX7_AMPAM|nr:hypothetical protein FJT64_020009 [Amphibalanus amphitrite]